MANIKHHFFGATYEEDSCPIAEEEPAHVYNKIKKAHPLRMILRKCRWIYRSRIVYPIPALPSFEKADYHSSSVASQEDRGVSITASSKAHLCASDTTKDMICPSQYFFFSNIVPCFFDRIRNKKKKLILMLFRIQKDRTISTV